MSAFITTLIIITTTLIIIIVNLITILIGVSIIILIIISIIILIIFTITTSDEDFQAGYREYLHSSELDESTLRTSLLALIDELTNNGTGMFDDDDRYDDDCGSSCVDCVDAGDDCDDDDDIDDI